MKFVTSVGRKALVPMVVAGAVSLCGVGVAGAAMAGAMPATTSVGTTATTGGGATSTTATTGTGTKALAQIAKHTNCANAQRKLHHASRVEARLDAKLVKLDAAKARAQSAGHTKRVSFLQKQIDRTQRVKSRLATAKVTARRAEIDKVIEKKCHVPAPAGSASTSSHPSAPADITEA